MRVDMAYTGVLGPPSQYPLQAEAEHSQPQAEAERDQLQAEPDHGVTALAQVAMPQVITVWGPSGAPGRSTVAINLGDALHRLGRRVLLIDCDVFNPSLALMLGAHQSGHTLATLFAALARNPAVDLGDYLVRIRRDRFALIAGLSNPARWAELSLELFPRVLAAAHVFDFVVFDVAGDIASTTSSGSARAGPDLITRFLVREGWHLVVVGDSNILGIDRLARVASQVRRLRPNASIDFVLNRRPRTSGITDTHRELFHRLTKESITATLPYDRKTISAALERGCTASAIRQRGEFSNAMLAFASRLVTP
ncbi:MAG: hypothetical protein RL009_111 [Actinomycetota bacterium]